MANNSYSFYFGVCAVFIIFTKLNDLKFQNEQLINLLNNLQCPNIST